MRIPLGNIIFKNYISALTCEPGGSLFYANTSCFHGAQCLPLEAVWSSG
jgi:hypothetical protein